MREEEYRELDELKNELHDLMKILVIKTNLGEIEESGVGGRGIEDVNLDFAEGSLNSCAYYGQVRFYDLNGGEHELYNDLNLVRRIFKELQNRLEQINSAINKEKIVPILNKKFEIKDILK